MKLKLTWVKSCTHCGVFNLQKAFNTVNHSILLGKLSHYGVRGTINDWLNNASYLVDQHKLVLKHIQKRSCVVRCPTGISPRPLLFPIYINAISNSSDKLKFYLFSDETNLFFPNKNFKLLESIVNAEN